MALISVGGASYHLVRPIHCSGAQRTFLHMSIPTCTSAIHMYKSCIHKLFIKVCGFIVIILQQCPAPFLACPFSNILYYTISCVRVPRKGLGSKYSHLSMHRITTVWMNSGFMRSYYYYYFTYGQICRIIIMMIRMSMMLSMAQHNIPERYCRTNSDIDVV